MDTSQMESSSGSSIDTSLHSPDGIATVLAPIRLNTPPPFLSTLPTELIREILESTVTRTFHSTTYQERQNTLYSLSLVSKLFRSIAQPLLLEVVWLKSAEDLEDLPVEISPTTGGEGALGTSKVNTVAIDFQLSKSKRVEAALRKIALVETLSIVAQSDHESDTTLLEQFEELATLQLMSCRWSIPRSPSLPNLRSLTFYSVAPEIIAALLNPVSLPSLEEFALLDDNTSVVKALRQSGFDKLLPQQLVLLFDITVWEDDDATFLHSAASRTLIDCSYQDLERHTFKQPPTFHMRIYDAPFDNLDERGGPFSETLTNFACYLQAEPSLPLQSIYLGQYSSLDSDFPRKVQESMGYLAEVCQERKIDLVFESDRAQVALDLDASPEFSRRQREKRRNATKS